MIAESISHSSLKLLVESGSVRSATAIAEGDCWSLVVRFGRSEKTLISKNGKVRAWRKLDTLAKYITKDLGIPRFETDGSDYDPTHKSLKRPDSSAVLKKAHAAAAHDQWFRNQVEDAVSEADNVNSIWTSQNDVSKRASERRKALRDA